MDTRGRAIVTGSRAVLGLRPQSLSADGNGAGLVEGRIVVAERLGSETVADLVLRDGTSLIATFAQDRVFTPDQLVSLRFNPADAHLLPTEA